MPARPIVCVIDDDEAVRDSIGFLLKTADIAARTYDSAVSFLAAMPMDDVGCIVTDVRMPELNGIELLRRLKQLKVSVPVVVITGHGDVPMAVEAMKIGASDFLEKPFDDTALLDAVRAALGHGAEDRARNAEREQIAARLATLSTRERQVLDGLIAGHPNKTIAFDLKISPRTVEIYRANLMSKMQASSLSALVRMALLAGASADEADR
jgi:two-component system response regulator FixJ